MKQYIHFKCWMKEIAPLRSYRRVERLKNIKSEENAGFFAKKLKRIEKHLLKDYKKGGNR